MNPFLLQCKVKTEKICSFSLLGKEINSISWRKTAEKSGLAGLAWNMKGWQIL
jgi:hypothetical protein